MKKNPCLPSLFKGFFTKQSVSVEWSEVYHYLTGEELRELTDRYRATKEWHYKSALLSLTPACGMNGKGKEADDLTGLTGFSMADFDHISPLRMEEVRALVNADPHTFLSHATASGEGFRVFFPYEEGGDYGQAFLTGNCYYADLIGVGFDEKCANVNRLSALCHDPLAFFNEEAVPFAAPGEYVESEFRTSPSPEVADSVPDKTLDSATPQTNNTPRSLNSKHSSQRNAGGLPSGIPSRNEPFSLTGYAAKVVEKHGDYYTPGNRNQYLMKCLMMMNKLGVPQSEAEQWASAYDLDAMEVRCILRSCYSHTAEHGIYEPPRPGNLQTCTCTPPSSTHPRIRAREKTRLTIPLPEHTWPKRIQQMVDCGETKAQRDIILLASFTVIGATLSRQLRVLYSHKYWYPCLQMFIVAPPASGKGAVSWVRHMAEPVHNALLEKHRQAMKVYRKQKQAYDTAGRKKTELEMPEQPPMKMFLIAGNNSSTGILENLMDVNGWGLICETEADTVSTAISTDYGGWSDTLRKVFEHDRLSYNRRTNHEYREISTSRLSVLLTGTPAQVRPLIPSAENGLYSRQLFYTMPHTEEWVDQFDCSPDNYDELFSRWGEEWKQVLDTLDQQVSMMELYLSEAQREEFNDVFARLFTHAGCTRDDHHMKSSVVRLAINVLRILSVVAALRALEEHTLTPADDLRSDNLADGIVTRFSLSASEEDFHAVLSLSEPLYRQATQILSLLPSEEAVQRSVTPIEQFFEALPMEFSRSQAMENAERWGISKGTLDSYLNRMKTKGQLVSTGRGNYAFAALMRKPK